MEQNSSSEVKMFSGSLMNRVLSKRGFYYRILKTTTRVSVLSHTNPIHAHIPLFEEKF
jgi:hypothetical protein